MKTKTEDDIYALLPEKIRILHTTYRLNKSGGVKLAIKGRLGEIDFNSKEINYLEGMGSDTADTLIHEALHGLWRIFDLGDDMEQEEHIVLTLATGLTTIMKDNPELFPALQAIIDSEED